MIVTSLGEGIPEALAATEQLGVEGGLEKKQILQLRLLAEELFSLLHSIAGEVKAEYLPGRDGKAYSLALCSDIMLTREMRDQFIAFSTSGENAAAKGFMGKIREMIATALLPNDSGTGILSGLSLGLMSMASPSAQKAGTDTLMWSMKQYKDEVGSRRGEDGAADSAWDELERSIVASIADEVSVRVTGSLVEIRIDKDFS